LAEREKKGGPVEQRLPLVVDIKRGSTEDGPGIRTTVFFKGCPLSCPWCQNPEAMDPRVEIGFYPHHCMGCFDCEEACPEGAILRAKEERIDRLKCTRCGRCADVCPGKGIRRIGTAFEVDELLKRLLRDRVFYQVSGGGVTLSGGEPTLWPEYTGSLLRRLKEEGIHTALQTCGDFEYGAFREEMLPWLDLVMYDLKLMDGEDHFRWTGRDNKRILRNFSRLLNEGVEVVPRIPLIPGFTTSEENLRGLCAFLKDHGSLKCSLLPYNPLGLSKWDSLGKSRSALPVTWMEKSHIEDCRKICEWA
jgi:pyruvate formate lyase activating enzyme